MTPLTLQECRALAETIKRYGGPQPHHRDLFARSCRQLEELEAEAAAGSDLGFPPLVVALGKALAVVFAGLTVYGGVRIVDRVSDSTATMLDRLSVLAVAVAAVWSSIQLWRVARSAP